MDRISIMPAAHWGLTSPSWSTSTWSITMTRVGITLDQSSQPEMVSPLWTPPWQQLLTRILRLYLVRELVDCSSPDPGLQDYATLFYQPSTWYLTAAYDQIKSVWFLMAFYMRTFFMCYMEARKPGTQNVKSYNLKSSWWIQMHLELVSGQKEPRKYDFR